jgi:elongation factor Ts
VAKVAEDQSFAAVVMINCETDFVGKTEEFKQFAKDILEAGVNKRVHSVQELMPLLIGGTTIEQKLNDMLGKTGEKMTIAHWEVVEAPVAFAYNHHGNRLATILGMSPKDGKNVLEVGYELAKQVAAMNPVAVDKEDVPRSIIDREIEIGKDQARQEGKPEEMLEKIATGKLNKFFKDSTLMNQEYIKDTKKTCAQYIAENDKNMKVTGFRRLQLGA